MRRSISLVAVLATALSLAACSSSTDDAPATDAKTTAAAAGGNLTIWVDETRKPAVEAAAAAFEKETGSTVELFGHVSSANQHDEAGQAAWSVPGVTHVANNLRILDFGILG